MKKIITVIAVIALLAVLGVVLFACVPSDLKKAEKKLEKKGYYVSVRTYEADDFDDDEIPYLGRISAEKDNESVTAYLCKDKDTAKKLLAEKKEDYEDQKKAHDDQIKEYKASLEAAKSNLDPDEYAQYKKQIEEMEYYSEFTYVQKGKWVYTGTKAGMKDFN